MADIVLKDGSDVSTTYRETKALGVDTPDGGIALFFSEEVIPKEYTHPDTHHASMITGLSNVARSGNYNDLVGKLVGDLPRLEEVTLKFAEILECMCRDIPGVWDNVLGHSFTIVWDGHPYEGVFKNVEDEDVGYSNGYYLGNLTKALNLGRGEDTGEPFVITVDIGDPTYCTIMTDDPKETHTISITPNSVKKLDKKYLPDEVATKDFVADEIAKIQASGGTSEIDIFPETELTLQPAGFDGVYFIDDKDNSIGIYDYLSLVELNKEYYVVLDGVEYRCTEHMSDVEIPEDVTVNSARVLGNLAITGPDYEDSGEPFVIQYSDMVMFETVLKSCQIAVKSDTPDAESITVKLRIYQKTASVESSLPEFTSDDEGKVLSIKDGALVWSEVSGSNTVTEIDLIGENELVFYPGDALGVPVMGGGYSFYQNASNAIDPFEMTVGESYFVELDGKTYEVQANDASAVSPGTIFLGNGATLGFPDTGEPFAIGYMTGSGVGSGVTVFDLTNPVIFVESVEFAYVGTGIDGLFRYECTLLPGSAGYEALHGIEVGKSYAVTHDTYINRYVAIDSTNELDEMASVTKSISFGYPRGIQFNIENYTLNGETIDRVRIVADIADQSSSLTRNVMIGEDIKHTFRLYQEKEATSSALPEFTSDDENKVLTIKDGTPTWSEVSGSSTVTEVEILPEKEYTLDAADAGLGFSISFDEEDAEEYIEYKSIRDLTPGEKYIVSFEGVSYECECQDRSKELEDSFGIVLNSSRVLGNIYYYDMSAPESSGEPFCIMFIDGEIPSTGDSNYPVNQVSFSCVSDIAAETINVKIGISKKGNSGAESSLPEFTQEDEGKVLSIKDGAPSWVRISGATTVTEVDVLAKSTIEFKLSGNSYNTSLPELFELIVDESYVVLWDDTEYNCVAYETEIGTRDAVCLGNKEVMTSGSTEILEPFVISHIPDVSVISLAVANGDESPSHAVRIYQKVESAPQYSWNDIADKPFGGEIQSIELMNDTISFDYLSKITEAFYGYGYGYIFNNDVSKAIDAGFNTATVEWNGTEYAVEPIIEDGAIILGNFEILDGIGDNGLPFAMAIGKADGEYGAEIYAIESIPPENIDNPEPITKTVKVSIEINNIKTIDTKYLPEHLQFGETNGLIEILPVTTYENFTLDSQYGVHSYGTAGSYPLTVDETYIVSWDDADYECVAQDAGSLLSGAVLLGNASNFGLSGNDEPFIIATLNGLGTEFFSLTDTEDGGSHSVRIVQERVIVKHIDSKYLPKQLQFGEVYVDATLINGTYKYVYEDGYWLPESYIPITSDIHLVVGSIYTLAINGEEYECECFNIQGLPAVGNPAVVGGEDNGAPLLIGEDADGSSLGEPGFALMPLEDPDPTVTTEVSYDIELTCSGISFKKLNSEYLPDHLQFGVIKAGTVLTEETTVYCAEQLGSDSYYTVVSSIGIIENARYHVMFDGNSYGLVGTKNDNSLMLVSDDESFVLVDNFQGRGVSVLFSTQGKHTYKVTLYESAIKTIDPKYIPSDIGSSSLPEVTTSDNNKVMTVVDGVWAAQTPASGLPEVTSSDAGKFLRVSSTGSWIVEALQDVSEVGA